MKLNIITWNIRHGLGTDKLQDIDRICNEILKKEPDVIAIQEIDRGAKRSKRIDQVEYIANELGYNYAFAQFFSHNTGGEYGLATFTKFDIVNQEVLNINPRGLKSNNKGLLVEMDVNGTMISHFNFHLPSTRNAACWRYINKYNFPPNSIISGDFNLNPNSTDIISLKSKWNDINEQDTHPIYNILDYNFSDLTPLETRVYETIASDHSMLETKYYL